MHAAKLPRTRQHLRFSWWKVSRACGTETRIAVGWRFQLCQRGRPRRWTSVRSEVNIELNFPPKLRGARSRLYRRRFLQVNTRWKALAEIYTMHSFAPFFKLKISAKNRQHFFAIEYWISDFVSFSASNLHFFLRIFYKILSGFRDKFQKRVTCVAFSIQFAKTN